MSMVQAWTRVGNGPWSEITGMSGDPRKLNAMVHAANAAATGGQQIALFSNGHNPNGN